MTLDRRELLRDAGALAGALALGIPARSAAQAPALPETAGHGTPTAPETLRRMVDLGLAATLRPGSPHDLRVAGNRQHLAATGTRWVRLWADWPSLQPDPAYAPDDPASPGAPWLRALDEQVEVACADGLRVLLLAHRFPLWANGLSALGGERRNTDAEVSFAVADRMSAGSWQRYEAAGRDPVRLNPSRRALELRVPPDGLGPGSAWAAFFDFLYARYHRLGPVPGRRVHGFELVNEPNFQLWPQRAPSPTADPFASGELVVHRAAADMMLTARQVASRHGHTTLVLAPSTADSEQRGRTVTPFDEFTVALLDELTRRGHHALPSEGWAHHDYLDIERRADDRLRRLRVLLADRWEGWSEGLGGPRVFLTEGGARLTTMRALYPREDPLAAQADCLRLAWERLVADDGAPGAAAMLTQYTTYADARFDCGLLDPWPATDGRPAYAAWGALPSHA